MSINKKFVRRQLGGNDVISTEEIIAEMLSWADDEIDALQSMLLREAAERLTMYRAERQQVKAALIARRSGYLEPTKNRDATKTDAELEAVLDRHSSLPESKGQSETP